MKGARSTARFRIEVLVGLLDLLELPLGLGVTGVVVGMVPAYQRQVGLLNLGRRRIPVDAEYVEVTMRWLPTGTPPAGEKASEITGPS